MERINQNNEKLLSKEKTIALVEKARSGDKNAMEALVTAYIGIAKKTASKYAEWTALYFDDLVQEGLMGVVTAVQTYVAERAAFSTHATKHIRLAILEAMKRDDGLIGIPQNILVKARTADKIRKEFQTQNKYNSNFDPNNNTKSWR